MRSITSSVSRMPAVSIIFKVTSFRRILSSIASLVVPAMSVTIARSCPIKALSREDLPTFGFPRMTVLTPSLIILPSSALSNNDWITFCLSKRIGFNSSPYPSISICSGSSSAASIYAICSKRIARSSLIFSETLPLSCVNALFNAKSFSALITSMTASAWLRSIRPFTKARFVNSPGSAGRAPFRITSSKVFFKTYIPPWQSISTVFSRV